MKLGYRPQYTLREALPGVVRWYDERITFAARRAGLMTGFA